MMLCLLAWQPIKSPLVIDGLWLLSIIPLAIVIAFVYKTLKLADMSELPKEASMLAFQILKYLTLAAIGLWVLTEYFT